MWRGARSTSRAKISRCVICTFEGGFPKIIIEIQQILTENERNFMTICEKGVIFYYIITSPNPLLLIIISKPLH
jgi:hypothetical protein